MRSDRSVINGQIVNAKWSPNVRTNTKYNNKLIVAARRRAAAVRVSPVYLLAVECGVYQ